MHQTRYFKLENCKNRFQIDRERDYLKLNLYSLIHFTRSLYWLQLHETFGPIVINMTRVFNDIIALVCTLIIFCVAFSVGMMHILDEQTEQKSNNTTTQKGNMHRDLTNLNPFICITSLLNCFL